MKVLITGHRGFVGQAFAEYLTSIEGAQWAARAGFGSIEAVMGIDVADRQRPMDCRRYFENPTSIGMSNYAGDGTGMGPMVEHFDLVIHCAAVIGGRVGIERDPFTLATEDLSIDAALWRWAKRAKPGRIVYFSSSAAYPIELQGPGREWKLAEGDLRWAAPGEPDMTYGYVKQVGERMARECNEHVCPVHVFRPFSGYGEAQHISYPWPAFLDRARRHEDPFHVWGDGRQVRDFVHIQDIVFCVLAAIEKDIRGPVNICTGIPTSFLELARAFIREENLRDRSYEPTIGQLMDQPVGVRYRVGDPRKMLEFYTPTVSLADAIAMALNRVP